MQEGRPTAVKLEGGGRYAELCARSAKLVFR